MISIFLEYFYWHWGVAPGEILKIMRNYSVANWHRFLIGQHFKTLFSPWHRQNPSDFGKKEKTFGDKFLDSLADIYIRLIAAGIRMMIILTGLVVNVLLFFTFLLILVVWLAWPILAIYSILSGFKII